MAPGPTNRRGDSSGLRPGLGRAYRAESSGLEVLEILFGENIRFEAHGHYNRNCSSVLRGQLRDFNSNY